MAEDCVAYPVVRLEIIDLFPKHNCPQVLTNELDNVERIYHSSAITREPRGARDKHAWK